MKKETLQTIYQKIYKTGFVEFHSVEGAKNALELAYQDMFDYWLYMQGGEHAVFDLRSMEMIYYFIHYAINLRKDGRISNSIKKTRNFTDRVIDIAEYKKIFDKMHEIGWQDTNSANTEECIESFLFYALGDLENVIEAKESCCDYALQRAINNICYDNLGWLLDFYEIIKEI